MTQIARLVTNVRVSVANPDKTICFERNESDKVLIVVDDLNNNGRESILVPLDQLKKAIEKLAL